MKELGTCCVTMNKRKLGSGPRYMICVTLFCTMRVSKNTRTCENSTLFKEHTDMRTRKACNSYMSMCSLTCSTCKNVLQNLIPQATAYRELTNLDKVLQGSPINTYIVIPASPKFYQIFISIIIHTFDAITI